MDLGPEVVLTDNRTSLLKSCLSFQTLNTERERERERERARERERQDNQTQKGRERRVILQVVNEKHLHCVRICGLVRTTTPRKWAHKIGKLQESLTRHIPCKNV